MTKSQVLRCGLAALAGITLYALSFSSAAAQQGKLRILQTNSAGDNIHIIDPATNKVVGEIKGIEASHGVATSADGSRVYISEEDQKTLDVIDGKTLQVIKRIPLSGNPNLIDMTPDGRWIYVAIAQDWSDLSEFPVIKAKPSGGVDVIDAVSLTNVKTIPIPGGIHDLNDTPDGKYVIAGSVRAAKPPANAMFVIDARTNEIAWTLAMNRGPSPMAVSRKPDGSTDKIFAQNGGDNAFAVVDFETHLQTDIIKLPELPRAQQNPVGGPSPSHGIGITPDQKTLLVNSRLNSATYAYTLPDLKLLGGAALGGKGAQWLTITPDNKIAYVANEQSDDVSVVDITSLKEVARIPVGFNPARNTLWMAP